MSARTLTEQGVSPSGEDDVVRVPDQSRRDWRRLSVLAAIVGDRRRRRGRAIHAPDRARLQQRRGGLHRAGGLARRGRRVRAFVLAVPRAPAVAPDGPGDRVPRVRPYERVRRPRHGCAPGCGRGVRDVPHRLASVRRPGRPRRRRRAGDHAVSRVHQPAGVARCAGGSVRAPGLWRAVSLRRRRDETLVVPRRRPRRRRLRHQGDDGHLLPRGGAVPVLGEAASQRSAGATGSSRPCSWG